MIPMKMIPHVIWGIAVLLVAGTSFYFYNSFKAQERMRIQAQQSEEVSKATVAGLLRSIQASPSNVSATASDILSGSPELAQKVAAIKQVFPTAKPTEVKTLRTAGVKAEGSVLPGWSPASKCPPSLLSPGDDVSFMVHVLHYTTDLGTTTIAGDVQMDRLTPSKTTIAKGVFSEKLSAISTVTPPVVKDERSTHKEDRFAIHGLASVFGKSVSIGPEMHLFGHAWATGDIHASKDGSSDIMLGLRWSF